MSRSHGYCFTINNFTENDKQNTEELLDSADYGIYGIETGASGTIHIQGYGYWKNNKTFNSIKTLIPSAHIESAKGNSEHNRKYCSKQENFKEFGTINKGQGCRNDIIEFRDAIIDGMDRKECWMNFPVQMAKYRNMFQDLRSMYLQEQAKKNYLDQLIPEVIVLIGDPGIGKTREVFTENDINDIYKVEIGDGSSGSIFWDGYDGQSVILIDDFHSNFKLDYMLRLLDSYPMKLNVKGTHTWKVASKIYITSNIYLEHWYPNCPEIHRKAMRRRITTIKNLKSTQAENTPHNNELA